MPIAQSFETVQFLSDFSESVLAYLRAVPVSQPNGLSGSGALRKPI